MTEVKTAVQRWYVQSGTRVEGPWSDHEVGLHLISGRVRSSDCVSLDGSLWEPVTQVPELIPKELLYLEMHRWENTDVLMALFQWREDHLNLWDVRCGKKIERRLPIAYIWNKINLGELTPLDEISRDGEHWISLSQAREYFRDFEHIKFKRNIRRGLWDTIGLINPWVTTVSILIFFFLFSNFVNR